MSKPITLSKPASLAVSTMPTTPPAGPESSASLPWKRSAAVSPPEDIMNISRGASACIAPVFMPSASATWRT